MTPIIENILIVKLSAIGDVIHTLPALNAVRRYYPRARITWLIEEAAADLINYHPALDRVLISRRKHWLRGLRGPARVRHAKAIYRFVKELRDTRYDIIFDFQASLKGSLLIALARGYRKIGFGRGLEHQEHSYLFLNETVPAVDMGIHALTRGLILLAKSGILVDRMEYRLPISGCDRDAIERILADNQIQYSEKFVVINPIAQWDTKLWANANFAALADGLIERYNVPIIFSGGPADRSVVDEITTAMRHTAVNLAGCTSLLGLAALYEQAALLVSTDTGPMHLAAAMGVPVVALFGPTAPWRTGPYGNGHRIVRSACSCAPCYKRYCDTIQCMAGISVEQVAAKIEQLGIL